MGDCNRGVSDPVRVTCITDAALADLAAYLGITSPTDLATILAATNKIDTAAATGLLGVEGTLSYEIEEAVRHVHSHARWFGAAVSPNGTIHVADRIGTTTASFQMAAGSNTWGLWLQLLGSSDTPADVGMTHYDPHKFAVPLIQRTNTVHLLQFGFGTSGAAALSSGNYTEMVYLAASALTREAAVVVQMDRQPAGTMMWGRVWAVGQVSGTMNLFIGLHEYEG